MLTLLVGFFTEQMLLVTWLVTLAYLAWHAAHLVRLEKWLRKEGSVTPPIDNGVWGELYYHIHRMRQRNRKSKRRLADVISRFRASTSALPDAAVVLRSGDEIEWFNGAAARLLGLKIQDDAGQRVINLLRHPAFADYLTEGDFSDSLEMPSPVDETMILEVNIIPYGGENQNLLIARDITQIKKLEQMRKDFIANVSHELRTPLTVLTGTLETMSDADDNETLKPWRRSIGHMQQHNQRMLNIVDDLLMISRLETEDNHPEHHPVSLSTMLAILHDEAVALSNKQHAITMEVSASIWLMGNEKELHSALSNLVANAIRYTPQGGTITIKCHPGDSGITFCVCDSGIGIAPHHIERLTERFYRVDAGRSRESGGTGLGLAIVKHVLDRHSAHLKIRSQIEKGSEFSCHFPQKIIHIPE